MPVDEKPPLLERLRAMLGAQGPPDMARDPVNEAMIRHWCDAMGDANPVYTDPDFAASSIHGGLVAPPAMLNAWTMPGLPGRRPGDARTSPLRALDEAGFTSVIATNSEHEYLRYLRPGDRLSGENALVDVSEEKTTALGRGHFVTSRTTYRTQTGEEVGRMLFRILKFEPGTGRSASSAGTARGAAPAPAQRTVAARELPPRPARRETTLRAADVQVGAELPRCPVAITTTLIVAGAIASRDYQDVHHDRDAALRRGTPDIFMNILTTCGLLARYVTDWAGPEALLTALRIRLGAPNHPGHVMLLGGRVAKVGGGRLELALRGVNTTFARGQRDRRSEGIGQHRLLSRGDHVTGTVELRLPR